MSVIDLAAGPDDERRVELFVRSLAPETARQKQESIIERLRNLEANGTVGAMELHVVGDCVCPSTVAATTETGQFLLERFETFQQWADRNGVELVGFRDRCIDSSMTGETVTGITFPRLCLAVFDGDDCRFVAPVAGDDGEETVPAAVGRLSEAPTDVA